MKRSYWDGEQKKKAWWDGDKRGVEREGVGFRVQREVTKRKVRSKRDVDKGC